MGELVQSQVQERPQNRVTRSMLPVVAQVLEPYLRYSIVCLPYLVDCVVGSARDRKLTGVARKKEQAMKSGLYPA